MANFNLNKVILGGRLTSDVELKQTQTGISTATFSIAVNRKTSGTQEQAADFITVRAWRGTAEFISRYFHKGSSICIVGSIQTRKWQDQDGQTRFATDVVADEAYFVDGKNEGQAIPGAPTFSQAEAPKFEEISDDDDLPF